MPIIAIQSVVPALTNPYANQSHNQNIIVTTETTCPLIRAGSDLVTTKPLTTVLAKSFQLYRSSAMTKTIKALAR